MESMNACQTPPPSVAKLTATESTLSTAIGNVIVGSSVTTGLLFVTTSTGAAGIYALKGPASTTAEVFDSAGMFTVVGGTTNSINVYWDSTDVVYKVENRTGSTSVLNTIFIGR